MPRIDSFIAQHTGSDNCHTIQISERIYLSKSKGLFSQVKIWDRAVFETVRTRERRSRKDLGFSSHIILPEFQMQDV